MPKKATTVRVSEETAAQLEQLKAFPFLTHDAVIKMLIAEHKEKKSSR